MLTDACNVTWKINYTSDALMLTSQLLPKLFKVQFLTKTSEFRCFIHLSRHLRVLYCNLPKPKGYVPLSTSLKIRDVTECGTKKQRWALHTFLKLVMSSCRVVIMLVIEIQNQKGEEGRKYPFQILCE